MNYANDSDVPMGLSMALAQNVDAMSYFSSLSHDEQQKIIDSTHAIQSKEEMRVYVQSLTNMKSR